MPGCSSARRSMPGSSLVARRRNSRGERRASVARRPRNQPPNAGACLATSRESRSPDAIPRVGHPGDRAARRGEAADATGNPRRARRCERSATRDPEQRRRVGPHRVQHQRGILNPVRQPPQTTRIGSAGAGAIRGHDAQSQLARHLREQVRRQPRIGQPVAEHNWCRALLANNLIRDHAAIAPVYLHPHMVARSGQSLPTRRPESPLDPGITHKVRPGPRGAPRYQKARPADIWFTLPGQAVPVPTAGLAGRPSRFSPAPRADRPRS